MISEWMSDWRVKRLERASVAAGVLVTAFVTALALEGPPTGQIGVAYSLDEARGYLRRMDGVFAAYGRKPDGTGTAAVIANDNWDLSVIPPFARGAKQFSFSTPFREFSPDLKEKMDEVQAMHPDKDGVVVVFRVSSIPPDLNTPNDIGTRFFDNPATGGQCAIALDGQPFVDNFDMTGVCDGDAYKANEKLAALLKKKADEAVSPPPAAKTAIQPS